MDDKEIRETIFDAIDRSLTGKHRTAAYEWLTRQLAIADAVRGVELIDARVCPGLESDFAQR